MFRIIQRHFVKSKMENHKHSITKHLGRQYEENVFILLNTYNLYCSLDSTTREINTRKNCKCDET